MTVAPKLTNNSNEEVTSLELPANKNSSSETNGNIQSLLAGDCLMQLFFYRDRV